MLSLAGITIYPLKSLDGRSLSRVAVLPSGALADDRRWALVTSEGEFFHVKRSARLQQIRATWGTGEGQVTLTSDLGQVELDLCGSRAACEQYFSEACGQALRLVENREEGFPDDREFPGPTLISTASVEAVAGWFAGLTADEVRRRFRANLEITGGPPFVEDHWYGPTGERVLVRIGSVAWWGTNPCQRCVVPSRDSRTGAAVPGFAAAFSQRREAELPAGVSRERFNHFYRLAVNTVLASGPGSLEVGDLVQPAGEVFP